MGRDACKCTGMGMKYYKLAHVGVSGATGYYIKDIKT